MAENNLYQTGELAEACGTTVRTVQYYDGKGSMSAFRLFGRGSPALLGG